MQAHAPELVVATELHACVVIATERDHPLLIAAEWLCSLLQSASYITMLWHFSVLTVCKPVCVKADHATERIIAHGMHY